MKNKLLHSMPPKITRVLEDGLDYRPDWRHLQVQGFLNFIDQSDAEALTRLREILSEEPDQFVRDLLLFHCDQPCGNYEDIAFAVKCQRDNCRYALRQRNQGDGHRECTS